MAHFEGKRYGCSCPDGICDMNCRMYRIAAGKPSKADCIRSMSDEELADFIAKALYGMLGGQPCLVGNGFEDCKNRWLNWLNQEVK